MSRIKRAAGLLTACVLLLTLLTGCGFRDSGVDPVEAVLGYSKDTVYFVMDGDEVTAEDYLFWLVQRTEEIDGYYKMMGNPGIDWEQEMQGTTAAGLLKEQAKGVAMLMHAVEKMAREEGVSYGGEDKAAYKKDRETVVDQEGGQEAYENTLLAMCITEEGMERANRASVLYQKLEEHYGQPGGTMEGSREIVREYVEQQGILSAKHILLLTGDPSVDGKTGAYSAEKIAQQRALAEDLRRQLREGGDTPELFDKLMKEYSEDSGLARNPDGYVFGEALGLTMVDAFTQGTQALRYGEVSDVVESEFGFHIIMRLDPTEKQDFLDEYLTAWRNTQMDALLEARLDTIEVETTPEFDALDAKDFYEKLLAYRETLDLPEETGQNEGALFDEPETQPEGDGAESGATGTGQTEAQE
ncbi:MAG: peptidylprolyl isomerase [Firmicutes bacterium]|nr:peptidylprolyl isomerase [Bacillota bacterium]